MLRPWWVCFCLLLTCTHGRAEGGWNRLKLGMTRPEVAAALGHPLFCSKGRGIERWIYDNGAEVLIHGLLIGWTTPGVANAVIRSTDIWQNGVVDTRGRAIALPAISASQSPASPTGRGVGSVSGISVVPRNSLPQRSSGRW